MSQRVVAFDVETPNSLNDRMSAVGITVMEGGQVVEEFYSLVNPEEEFEPFNVELTGITPEMVAHEPTFPQLWETIRPILEQGMLVAHNAPFDMSVLAKCLRDYGLTWHKRVPYTCTCQMSRRLIPQSPNHKLNTLCDYFGLELDHHHAGSDSRACGEIFFRCVETGADVSGFVRTYDVERIRTEKRR